MTDHDQPMGGELIEGKRDGGAELRTIAFRLREIQRLLGARVAQENRRLEAEGLEPVTDRDLYKPGEAREEEL